MTQYQFAGRFTVFLIPTGLPWNENCYVVHDRSRDVQIIIDPGGRLDQIKAAVEAGGSPAKALLLTHAHHDHVRAAADAGRVFGISCHIHSADFPLLKKAPSYSIVFGGKPFPPVREPVALESSDSLSFLADTMRVLHTPGHTPGSCCLLFPGFAFTGDTLLHRKVGRTDLPGCDRSALIASVDNLVRLSADGDVLFAGHGNPWTAGEARSWWSTARADAPSLDAFEEETFDSAHDRRP